MIAPRKPADVEVFKRPGDHARDHFFDRVERIDRGMITERGREELVLHCASGGTIRIVTDRPWIWIEPERH